MILVDTSVWVNHLRQGSRRLEGLLDEGRVACHPYVIGELACGTLHNRAEILSLLQALPSAATATQEEFLAFVGSHRLMGRGIGFVDVHLLASALLSDLRLWTSDKRLRSAAQDLGLSYP